MEESFAVHISIDAEPAENYSRRTKKVRKDLLSLRAVVKSRTFEPEFQTCRVNLRQQCGSRSAIAKAEIV